MGRLASWLAMFLTGIGIYLIAYMVERKRIAQLVTGDRRGLRPFVTKTFPTNLAAFSNLIGHVEKKALEGALYHKTLAAGANAFRAAKHEFPHLRDYFETRARELDTAQKRIVLKVCLWTVLSIPILIGLLSLAQALDRFL